jgi:predicted enzyme related to lactoylglutathione lyase
VPINVVIDSQDPALVTSFWCGLLDVDVMATHGEGEHVVLAPYDGLIVGFQRVPEAKIGKNRIHLDVLVDDLDEGTARVEALGGHWMEPGNTLQISGFSWRCMADPEGNEFCIYVLPSN